MKIPVIDLGERVDCRACLDLCLPVLRRNDIGYIEVVELSGYLKEEIEEIMKNCLGGCVTWEEA